LEDKEMKKTFLVVLAVLMIGFPLFAGGGGQQAGSGAAGSQQANSITVACLEGWYSAVSMNDNLPVWQEVEKRTGIHVNWQANADYDTAMQPVIASGSSLPDLMLIPPSWSGSGVYKLGRDGVILQLDNLIASAGPNVQKLFRDEPELKAYVTAPDGKIYSVCDAPMFVNDMVITSALFLRNDWLKKLGLKTPETLDEWHTVLTAFRDRDPNGNGLKDEIPFGNTALGTIASFASAFGLPTGVDTWWYDNGGKVFYVPTSTQYRELIRVMSQWYKEGLLDIEINRDEPNFQSSVSTNVIGSFATLSERVFQYNNLLTTAGVTGVDHILVDPPKTPVGINLQVLKRPPVWSHYGITKDARNPELVMKWIDFVWASDEGVTLNEWGIEGRTYTVVNGKKQFTDFVLKNSDGLDPYNALRSLGIANTILSNTPAEIYPALNLGSPAIPFAEKLLPYRAEPFPALMLSDEDQAVIDRINPDLSTYTNEMLTKFLIGEIPFSEWDTYVRTVQSMGLDEIQRVQQRVYDRSK
jgi:putative aldouronate transport system substrate-binding protein